MEFLPTRMVPPGLVLVLGIAASGPVNAQQAYPARAIRFIVPYPPGAGTDFTAREVGQQFAKALSQPVVIDNRPGAGSAIGSEIVAKAAPDGYTLLTGTTSTISVNPVVMKDLPHDPIKEFRPVILFGLSPTVFVVGPNVPGKTVKEFAAAMKKSGNPLAVGNYSAGYELLSHWFGLVNGLAITPVPYKGGSPVMTDVIGGQIPSGMIDSGGAAPLIREGRMPNGVFPGPPDAETCRAPYRAAKSPEDNPSIVIHEATLELERNGTARTQAEFARFSARDAEALFRHAGAGIRVLVDPMTMQQGEL